MVLGICSMVFCWAYGIFSIGLGIAAVILGGKQLKSGPDGKAKAGKITGIFGIILGVISLIIWIGVIVLIAVNATR